MRRFVLPLAFVLLFTAPLAAAIPQSERDALIAFFNAAGGPQWTNKSGWLGAPGTECTGWYGVQCTNDGALILSIDLYDNNVSALAIDTLLPLTALDTLNLNHNGIIGTLGSNIGQLKALRILDLADNRISGTLPQALTSLTKLEVLKFGGNQLTGTLPSGLSALTKLQILEGYDNDLTGPIPQELTTMKELLEINFTDANLSGPIPPELGSLPNLIYLQLSGNELTGTIPSQLGALTKLEFLDLGRNHLTGSIPSSFANLTSLRELDVSALGLTGEVPEWLFRFPNITYVLLGGNRFSGSIPSTLSSATKVFYLDLSNNQLSGPLPDLAPLQSLAYLSLNDNNLSGPLVGFSELTNLVDARIERNDFSGPLPSFDRLSKIFVLLLGANHFTGQLPSSIGSLANLEVFSVFGNRLDGTIPESLGNAPKLTDVDLTYNQFTGPIPSSLANLKVNQGNLRLDYNLLFTSDAALSAVLTEKQGSDWTLTQTVPPTNVRVSEVTDRSALVTWDIIPYVNDDGGYEVIASTSPNGRAEAVAARAWKGGDSAIIRRLRPSTQYFFSVRTYTEPHDYQQSTLRSAFTAPVSATTGPRVVGPAEVIVTARPRGLVELDGVIKNTDEFTVSNVGDVATTITLTPTDNFFTIAPASFSIAPGATQTIVITGVPRPVGTYEAEVVASGAGVAADFWVPVHLVSMAAPTGDVSAEPVVSRLDFEGEPNSVTSGIVSFRNNGTTTLRGAVQSDSPWLIAPVTLVTIEPGFTANIAVTIDRRERAQGEEGTEIGRLTLLYGDASPASKLDRSGSGDLGVSISVVSIVDTTHPTTTNGAPPPLAPNQLAFFAPAVKVKRFGSDIATDVTIANAFGSRPLDDLRLFFSNASSKATTQSAVSSVSPSSGTTLANVVGSLFKTSAAGGVQLRTALAQDLAMSAHLSDGSRSNGELRGSLPVFRSDCGVRPGQTAALTGLRKSATLHSDLELQEVTGSAATVTVAFFGPQGNAVGASKTATLDAFGSADLADVVPTGAVSAIVTNDATSAGRIAASAIVVDATSGDLWSIVDWRRYYDLAAVEPLRVPLTRTESTSTGGRARPVRRGTSANAVISVRTTTALSLFNSGATIADGTLNYVAANGATSARHIELAPQQTMTVDDAASFFGRASETASITYAPDHGTLAMTARISTSGSAGAVGTSVPVTASAHGLRRGESHDFAGLEAAEPSAIAEHTPGAKRTALTLAETAGESATARVTLTFAGNGDLSRAIYIQDFPLAAGAIQVFPDITATILGSARATKFGALHSVALRVQVIDGGGSVLPMVEQFDSGNGDSDLMAP